MSGRACDCGRPATVVLTVGVWNAVASLDREVPRCELHAVPVGTRMAYDETVKGSRPAAAPIVPCSCAGGAHTADGATCEACGGFVVYPGPRASWPF